MRFDEWRGSLDGRPTLWVRHLLCFAGRHVDLHKMVAVDDAECFHSHPAYAVRVILAGGYVEELSSGEQRTWRPGMIGLVRPAHCHRIHKLRKQASYSLWIRFRKCAPVILKGNGWLGQERTHQVPGTIFQCTTEAV